MKDGNIFLHHDEQLIVYLPSNTIGNLCQQLQDWLNSPAEPISVIQLSSNTTIQYSKYHYLLLAEYLHGYSATLHTSTTTEEIVRVNIPRVLVKDQVYYSQVQVQVRVHQTADKSFQL